MWLKNLPLKITALGLAVLLWFHVATNREYDYAAELPLAAGTLPPSFALTSPLPTRARVLLRGTGKEMLRLLFGEGRLELLLEPWLDGTLDLEPGRLLLETAADVRVTQVLEPGQVEVSVDTVIQRSARIKYNGVYGTAAGVSLVRVPQVDPFYVTLTGPQKLTRELSLVDTEPLNIEDLDKSRDVIVGLALDPFFNVSASPESVHVRFEVAPAVRRDIVDVPVEVPRGRRADPPTVTLVVSGAALRLDSLSLSDFRVSAGPAPGGDADSLVSVEATVPSLVEILGITPDRVRIVKP